MKYLVVGLLLIVNLAGHAARLPPEPWDMYASASFRTVDPAGVVTQVDVSVNATPTLRQVDISLQRTSRICAAGVCRERDVISGSTSEEVGPAEAILDPQIRRGAIHSTIHFHDDVSNSELPVRVDVVWIATGPETCDSLYDALGCFRAATASGDAEGGSLVLILGRTDPDGRLLRRLVQN